MIFLGHIGATVCAAQLGKRWLRAPRLDLRAAALFSILPDLVDKPLGFLFPEVFGYHTRLYAHSLLGAAVVLLLLLAFRRRIGHPFVLWLCYAAHLACDRMWTNDLAMLFWPFLGEPKPLEARVFQYYISGGFRPWVLVSEAVGVVLFAGFVVFYRLYRLDVLRRLVTTGELEREARR